MPVESSTLYLQLLYCCCSINKTLWTNTASATDSHALLSNVTGSPLCSSKDILGPTQEAVMKENNIKVPWKHELAVRGVVL